MIHAELRGSWLCCAVTEHRVTDHHKVDPKRTVHDRVPLTTIWTWLLSPSFPFSSVRQKL
jgi:hypothetical protein